ncbi:MAG TPA: insulinase family protein, partial [Burkholderiaceae bacterium]
VVGAVPDGLEAAVEQAFGTWKKADAPRFVREIPQQVNMAPGRIDVPAKDKANAELHMNLRFALNTEDADYLPLLIATRVFGAGGMETRLAVRVRGKEGLSYGVGASLQVPYFGRDAGLVITASFAPANRESVIAAVQDELRRMSDAGVTSAEMERARNELLQGARQGRASDGALAGQLLFLADTKQRWVDEGVRDLRLRAVTLAQVNAAWRRLVRPEGFLISTVGDFK